MKATKRIAKLLSVGCVLACCLPLFTPHAFAIEGLQVSVQNTNAVLSWPSDPSESYIVQYEPSLISTSGWVTLQDYYPADSSTNITFFVDPNPVDFGSSGGGSGTNSGGGIPVPGGGGGGSGGTNTPATPGLGFYRVVRDGIHLVGITNNMVLTGVVKVPVEFANTYGDISTMVINEDDSPVGNSVQTAPLSYPPTITLDTTVMSNGVHQIFASARWEDTNGGAWEADSPTISVTTSNEITFENWMPNYGELGNTLFFRATSAHLDTDWYVDTYDSSNNYIGTFGGHTYDGDISFYWDLVDPYGNTLTNSSFFIFKISTEYIDPPTPPTFKVTDPWSGAGAWVVVAQHAWDSAHDTDLLYAEIGGFIGGALNAGWNVLPSPQGQNDYGSYYAYGLTFGSENQQGDTDWQNFRNALYDPGSRNLAYFGHGGPNGIGYNPANTNRYISASEIASRLHTNPLGQPNRHAFRFVFLDGCATAKGNLPEAFGILHRKVTNLDDYTYASLRPSAFAGWTATKWISFLDNQGYINTDHFNFIQHIQTQMLLGWGLQESIDYAASASDVNWSFVWLNQMQVYGYYDLHFGQYNN